jgi:hypothetical protein
VKEKKKYIKALWLNTFMMLIFCSPALSAPYSESDFYSLYQPSRTYTYVDTSGVTKTQSRVGFQFQNDFTDPIVVCGKEGDTSCVAAIYNSVKTLRASYTGKITAFKVYVPPGTKSVNLLSHVGQSVGSQYVTIARLGIPPLIDKAYIPTGTVYDNLPNDGFTLSDLRRADCVGKNSSGYLYIAKDSGINVTSESEGGWLYVIVKVISGNIIDNVYSNQVDLGSPSASGTYLGWYTDKTTYSTWGTLGERSYIGTSAPTPTPTPTVTTTPTPIPTPTTTPTGCDSFACANSGGTCVNNVCVISTPRPTPTTTPTSNTCDPLLCALSLGTCVNGTCVKHSTTPTPTPIPSPSPSPSPSPTALSFVAKPAAELVVQEIPCSNIDLLNLAPVLMIDAPPDGNAIFYSALLFPGVPPSVFISQKDILGNDAFILLTSGDSIKGNVEVIDTVEGSWKNYAFKSLLTALMGKYPDITCATVADSGVSFMFGYALNGDLNQFQGAAFTFVNTP